MKEIVYGVVKEDGSIDRVFNTYDAAALVEYVADTPFRIVRVPVGKPEQSPHTVQMYPLDAKFLKGDMV